MKSLSQDWPHQLRLSPRFHAVSLVWLLLISGCAFLNKRPPYPDPDRLVSVVKVASAGEEPILGADFLALRRQSQTLQSIAGYVLRDRVLNGGSEPERIHSALVTADIFPMLGAQPVLGRALTSQDGQSGATSVVIISHDLWRRRFGADPTMIGKNITLDQEMHTVIGVMPPEFRFPKECQAWTPLAFDDESLRSENDSLRLDVIARLKRGVQIQQAQTEMSDIARKLERDYPANNIGRDLKLTPLIEK